MRGADVEGRGFGAVWWKSNVIRLQAVVAQRVGRGNAILFYDRGTRRGWMVSSTPRPHFTPGKDPVPILQEDGWAAGPVWTGGKARPQRNSIPDRPARSQSLIPTGLPGPRTLVCYPQICLGGLRRSMHKLSTDSVRVAICMLVLQHVKQEFYTFKCRVRCLGLVLDI